MKRKKGYRNGGKKTGKLRKKLNVLLLITTLPLVIMLAALLYALLAFNNEYAKSLQNANIAAEFNNKFKTTLDGEMLKHVYKPRTETSVEDLPWDVVNQTVELLEKLQKTTTTRENKWRINSMLNMCEYLSAYMIDIANTPQYDERVTKLENNINTVTKNIETYMHDYIYDEINHLTDLQKSINERVVMVIVVSIPFTIVLFVLIVWYAIHFTRRITDPISQLSRNVEQVGEGKFAIAPVKTHIQEIQTLDEGFQEMVARINTLMQSRIQDQEILHRTEMELLQAQINPHFLYNTLDSIVWLAETHRDDEVIQMVTSLSVFFRNSLSKGQDIITLEAEQEQVKSYLEIQKIRYSDILEYEIQIPDSLLNYTIPKLTLQPLVENAIYHGIKHKRGIGCISITGVEEEDGIAIVVADNGGGMTTEKLEELRAEVYEDRHTGLGLINVHKRITLYCGPGYGLFFESQAGEGTQVTVRIPKKNTLIRK